MTKLATVFALLCVLTTSCIQDAEPGKASISDGAPPTAATEPTAPPPTDDERAGEAQEPVTSNECWAVYKAGEATCQGMPPNAAMGCFLTIRAILAVCLVSAR